MSGDRNNQNQNSTVPRTDYRSYQSYVQNVSKENNNSGNKIETKTVYIYPKKNVEVGNVPPSFSHSQNLGGVSPKKTQIQSQSNFLNSLAKFDMIKEKYPSTRFSQGNQRLSDSQSNLKRNYLSLQDTPPSQGDKKLKFTDSL